MHNDDARNLAFSKEMVGIGDGSQLPPTVEPPTAAQVQSVTVPMNAIKLWEMDAFLDMWSQLFEMAFLLLKQFYFADSPDGKKTYVDEQTDELREIAESDFQHDFIIKAGGDPSMNDQNMMMQSAVAWMQMFGMNPNFAWMVEPTEFGPDISQMMLPGVFAKKWLHKSQNPQQDRQQFLQMQASALAQRQANQQKRQGASQQAAMPGVGGKNFGSMRMGM